MKSRSDIIAALQRCKAMLSNLYPIRRIGLFGSYARNEQTDSSDVDVVVEVDPSIGFRFVELAQRIEEMIGLPTDVVSQSGLKPQYLRSIMPDIIYV